MCVLLHKVSAVVDVAEKYQSGLSDMTFNRCQAVGLKCLQWLDLGAHLPCWSLMHYSVHRCMLIASIGRRIPLEIPPYAFHCACMLLRCICQPSAVASGPPAIRSYKHTHFMLHLLLDACAPQAIFLTCVHPSLAFDCFARAVPGNFDLDHSRDGWSPLFVWAALYTFLVTIAGIGHALTGQ